MTEIICISEMEDCRNPIETKLIMTLERKDELKFFRNSHKTSQENFVRNRKSGN